MASCSNCGAGLSGQFCARCGADNETALAGTGAGASPSFVARASVLRMAEQRHGVPLLISFFIPGLGQLAKGDWVSALFFFVANVIAGLLCLVAIGFVLLPIVWIWNLYDAYVSPDGQTKRELKRIASLSVILACALVVAGCGSVTAADPPPDRGSGGSRGSGGVISSGGRAGTGGIPAGGMLGTGGIVATGGNDASGGAAGAGGSAGGTLAMGGAVGSGGMAAGGNAGIGGVPGTGSSQGGMPGGIDAGACDQGQVLCGSKCEDLSTSNEACGGCERPCSGVCASGACFPICLSNVTVLQRCLGVHNVALKRDGYVCWTCYPGPDCLGDSQGTPIMCVLDCSKCS
jgi:TM2 domain-containing membrane protein YozV